MSNQTDSLVAERAQALSMILLTSREDLRVIEPKQDTGIDFLVEISKPRRAARHFGVQWKAQVAPATDAQVNQALRPTMRNLARAYEYTYPVCLFYFTMQDDKARYTWVAGPAVQPDGRPDLVLRTEANCAALDQAALDRIVRLVEEWYDARQRAAPSSTGRRSRSGAEVFDAILDAQAEYVAAQGKEPTVLQLPLLLAFDLAKLGRDGLGELAQTLMRDGVHALEGQKLLGMTVHLVPGAEQIAVE
jgi:hypothetical protein